MSREAVERLLGRLLTDNDFRLRTVESLADACREQGYGLNDEELRAISWEDLQRFEAVAARLDGRIKRFSHK